jgi:predicted dehydrogenase
LGPFPNRVKDVGVVLDLATHDIDLTQWLMNSRYQKVTAHSSFRSGGINEDLVSVVGMLENGVVINHNVNWLSPLKERKVIITGEKGTFVVDTLRSDLTFYENGSFPNTQRELAYFRGVTQGEVTVYAFEKPEALKIEHLEFIKGLSGGQSETVSLDEATETIKVAESILSSTITGETVKI